MLVFTPQLPLRGCISDNLYLWVAVGGDSVSASPTWRLTDDLDPSIKLVTAFKFKQEAC